METFVCETDGTGNVFHKTLKGQHNITSLKYSFPFPQPQQPTPIDTPNIECKPREIDTGICVADCVYT